MENNVTKIAAQLKTGIKATGTSRIRRSAFPLEIQHTVSPRKYSINRIKTNKQTKQKTNTKKLKTSSSCIYCKTEDKFFFVCLFFSLKKKVWGRCWSTYLYHSIILPHEKYQYKYVERVCNVRIVHRSSNQRKWLVI